MFANSRNSAPPLVATLLGLLGLVGMTACNSGQQSLSVKSQSGLITGAGSTFVNPVMTRWISDFQTNHGGVHINYQSIGKRWRHSAVEERSGGFRRHRCRR